MKKDKKKEQKVVELDAIEQINHNAAGIDVGAKEFYVAVPKGRDTESVRTFLTFTADIQRLADWLAQCGVKTVALTATAHKLATIFYFMLKRREAYRPLTTDYYEKEHRDKVVRSLQRRAATLGFRLEPTVS